MIFSIPHVCVCLSQEHMQTHQAGPSLSSQKPRVFQCDTCEKAFAKPSQLERHSRIHTGDRAAGPTAALRAPRPSVPRGHGLGLPPSLTFCAPPRPPFTWQPGQSPRRLPLSTPGRARQTSLSPRGPPATGRSLPASSSLSGAHPFPGALWWVIVFPALLSLCRPSLTHLHTDASSREALPRWCPGWHEGLMCGQQVPGSPPWPAGHVSSGMPLACQRRPGAHRVSSK